MEKLKNLVNPGAKKDDEVMYGTGRSDDPVHTGDSSTSTSTGTHSGQGSHFGNTRNPGNDALSSFNSGTDPTNRVTGGNPLSTSTNPTGSSQYDGGVNDRGTGGLNEPYASRMPGGFDDDAATTASVSSGVPGHTTQTGSGMTGTHDLNLANKSLPRDPATAGTGPTGSTGSHTTGGSSLSGDSYPDRSAGPSALGNEPTGSSHLGRDAAIGVGALGAGTAAHHHDNAQHDNYAPETGRSFPLGGSSNTTSGSNYPSSFTGGNPVGAGSTITGPHSSNFANKADPGIDSGLDGSRTVDNTGSHSTANAPSSSVNQGSLGRDAALGTSTSAAAGDIGSAASGREPQSWQHEHNKHGPRYEGDPCEPNETTAAGPHFVQGPHATDTANRLDPHVAGSTEGLERVPGHTHAHDGHSKGKAALASGATEAGSEAYEGTRGHRGPTTYDSGLSGPTSSTASSGGVSSGPAPKTAGPHKSDMMNKIDPRVDSDLSKQQGTAGTGVGSSTAGTSDPYSAQTTGHSHYRGEEAALGGTGLAGAVAYEGHKHHNNRQTGTASTQGSSNQYGGSSIDPYRDSSRSGLGNTINTTAGAGNDHHLARDAALGAGAGGLAHKSERHRDIPSHSSNVPGAATDDNYDSTRGKPGYDQAGNQLAGSGHNPASTRDHHLGRDAALGAGAGGLAYEADKLHGTGHPGIASTPQDQLAGSGHQAQGTTLGNDSTHQNIRGHHLGRDAAVGGTTLGAGTAGVDEHQKFHGTSHTDPDTAVRENQHPGASIATYPSTGYGSDHNLQDYNQHKNRKEEEVLAGGAAAGGLAHHEHSKKDEKAFEKEHAKEVKQHDKTLKKEEKAIEKDERQHEKERAKHMAAIEKDQKKHDHDHEGEKKKGGLLGFLHRDKPDKELKEEEARRQASGQLGRDRPGDEEMSAGAGATSYADSFAGEHGSQSGVHDAPIGSGGNTTHDAYGTKEGHNKLHKDPPAKMLGARGPEYQGHGNVS